MKNKRDIIIVTLCIVTALACITLTFMGNVQKTESISSETFFGVIATLIGICAAIIVGFQIAHFLELRDLKDQVNDLNKAKDNIYEMSEELQKNLSFVKVGVSSTFRVFYREFDNVSLASVACIIAIIAYDTTNKEQASKTLLGNYRHLYKMLTHPKCNARLARKYIYNLEELDFPKDLEDYDEICKLHFEVISLLIKSGKGTKNPFSNPKQHP